MNLKVSIITCTLNSRQFLEQSIASVLSQDYTEIEYIFVDGGSTDGTLDLISEVNRPYFLEREITGGISRAMNRGIEIATGDIIAHLHSDDYYLHDRVISQIVEALCSTGADWCFGRHMEDVSGVLKAPQYAIPHYNYRRLLKGNFIPHPSTFVKKKLFERLGLFNETIKYAMDYDMWLRLGKVSNPAQLDEYLSAFRVHQNSLSTANKLAGLKESHAVRLKYLSCSWPERIMPEIRYRVRKLRMKRTIAKDPAE